LLLLHGRICGLLRGYDLIQFLLQLLDLLPHLIDDLLLRVIRRGWRRDQRERQHRGDRAPT
jgi:hypothetical protein